MSQRKAKTLWTLFFSMLYISAFTFGGGFVIVTFMKRRFVDELHWISEQEMLDMTALAQSSPGAIAVNAAVLVGWKMGGFIGMLVAVLGTVIPPMFILSLITLGYQRFASNHYVALILKGMSCGVAAVILDVSISLAIGILSRNNGKKGGQPQANQPQNRWIHGAIMVCAFIATFFLHVNVVWIILAASAVGILLSLRQGKGGTTA